MKIRDLIEAFNTPVQGQITSARPNMFKTRAKIGNRDILVNAAATQNDQGEEVWEVNFVERSPEKGTTFGKSGSGNEMAVFSFVIDSLKEFAARYSPQLVEFSASRKDRTRSQLYQRMISRGVIPGYRLIKIIQGPTDDIFTLQNVKS